MSFFNGVRPYVVAGPCSAETEEQIMATGAALAAMGIPLFRAGVWKPRTRPGSFEGNGTRALHWLQAMKQQYNLPFTVEVAEVAHIEEALTFGTDVLWIGARTTVNPFQVQKLADALRGVQVPVMVKNPVNADIDLWIGAIERMEQAGLEVAAVHRGFSGQYASGGYRNPPHWPIPIELKRRRPDLMLLCDPSHITGKRDRIAEVAQKAMDMRFDGLMIETHPDPTAAWTDAAQQITPAQLQLLLQQLVVRQEFTADMGSQAQLEYIRTTIDSIDQEIIDLVARRMELCEQIGQVKRQCNMTAYQPARWREIVQTVSNRAATHELSDEFVLQLYEQIHHESIRLQLRVLSGLQNEIKT